MERVKIMPRHLLLIILPVIAAILGGMLTTGNLSSFMAASGGNGISQAQLYLALSLLTGLLAFSWRCLPKSVTYGVLIFTPLVYGLLAMPQLGIKVSLMLLYALNLAFATGLWLALKLTFFSKAMLRIRTAGFAIVASLLLTAYFWLLYQLLNLPFPSASWGGYFWNSLFLFIFVGFGLSLADIIVIRKEVSEMRNSRSRHDEEEEEEEEDDDR